MRASTLLLLIALAVLCLMAWEDLAVPQVENLSCTNWPCDIYVVIRDFQTLIGGGLAILAAWIAAQPAWRQLASLNLQQEIAARQIIVERLNGIQSRLSLTAEALTSISQEMDRELLDPHSDEPYEPSSVNAHWAFDQGMKARALSRQLASHQALRQDTSPIEMRRQDVISRLEELAACLNDVSAVAQYSGYPDLTPEQEDQLPHLEENARLHLPEFISRFEVASRSFREAGDAEILRFRTRLRNLDDRILS